MGRRWIGAAVLLASLAALGLQTEVVTRTGFLMGDFRAFYCAARVASTGSNPYHTEPLRSCETSLGMTPFFKKNPGVAFPAPLPGYSLAALEPLAALPFPVAAALWALLLALACAACVFTLARFARIAWESALAVFALALAALSLPFGEVVPIALGCISLSGYFAWPTPARRRARRGRRDDRAASRPAGLPCACRVAACDPRDARLRVRRVGVLSLLALGPATNLEYFTSVLPAHALSETTRDTQYSLTAVLAALGLRRHGGARRYALVAAMVVAGTIFAGMLAKRPATRPSSSASRPAFAVFGGTFIHIAQIAAALPAAVLLAGYAPRAYRNARRRRLLRSPCRGCGPTRPR